MLWFGGFGCRTLHSLAIGVTLECVTYQFHGLSILGSIDLAVTSLLANRPVASESGSARDQCLKALPHVTISSTISSTMDFKVAKIASA